MLPKEAAHRTGRSSAKERIRILKGRTPQDIVRGLRSLLYPVLTARRLYGPPAPLILQLLKIRLDAGKLPGILRLRTHPQLQYHSDILTVLEDHDVDYLELVETLMTSITDEQYHND